MIAENSYLIPKEVSESFQLENARHLLVAKEITEEGEQTDMVTHFKLVKDMVQTKIDAVEKVVSEINARQIKDQKDAPAKLDVISKDLQAKLDKIVAKIEEMEKKVAEAKPAPAENNVEIKSKIEEVMAKLLEVKKNQEEMK